MSLKIVIVCKRKCERERVISQTAEICESED